MTVEGDLPHPTCRLLQRGVVSVGGANEVDQFSRRHVAFRRDQTVFDHVPGDDPDQLQGTGHFVLFVQGERTVGFPESLCDGVPPSFLR